MTPELKHLEVLKQGCAHLAFLSYFANFSRKLICLAPDKDVPVRIITGRSREKLTLMRVVVVSDYLIPNNKIDLWLGSQVIEPSDDSTTTHKGHVFILGHSKCLNKAGGYLLNKTNYIEKSFSDHPTPRSRAEQIHCFSPRAPNQIESLVSGVSCLVSRKAKRFRVISLNNDVLKI